MNRSWKVLLDANIYIAGLASNKGPSGRILQLARSGCLKIYSSKFILSEVERNLKKKLPKILEFFYRDLVEIDLKVVYTILTRRIGFSGLRYCQSRYIGYS